MPETADDIARVRMLVCTANRLRFGRFSCMIRKVGMDCRNARTQHGFLLNGDGWRLD